MKAVACDVCACPINTVRKQKKGGTMIAALLLPGTPNASALSTHHDQRAECVQSTYVRVQKASACRASTDAPMRHRHARPQEGPGAGHDR